MEKDMVRRILNNPEPSILMNSMRSIGYSFETAAADIIDNSISAHATEIKIFTPINPNDISVVFFDNGDGMNRDELINAMKYGSKKEYNSEDLGRFGLGLKSASLSQCRKLIVASKKNEIISVLMWDLDYATKEKSWCCLELDEDEIKKLPKIDMLNDLKSGTLVIWQEFDIISKKKDGLIIPALQEEVENMEHHIALVFHRFLNKPFSPLKIYINEDKVKGLDPFLENHPKSDIFKEKYIKYNGKNIRVQQVILPHTTDLSDEDIEKLGGIDSFRKGQGFYIYRNNRLITYGTWFKLASTNLNSELYKYGRIMVDIPNSLDEEWGIDIKKQNANIPISFLQHLKKAVSDVRTKSESKNSKRARLNLEKDDNKIWNKRLNREQKEMFFINTDSNFVKNFINDFEDKDKAKIIRLLDIISSSIPYNDIYNSMCNRKIDLEQSQNALDSIIIVGINQINYFRRKFQFDDEKIFELLKTYEPFNNENILALIKEKLYESN